MQNLRTGQRHPVGNPRGGSFAPAWAPGGDAMAFVLTQDGNSQIYAVRADGSGLRRLSQSLSIDTEPQFSADGKRIFFTSDRGGTPQIYAMPAEGGEAKRITFDGSYNAMPRPSPDGRSLAYLTRRDGRFLIAMRDLASGQTTVLAANDNVESFAFAPNGRVLLLVAERSGLRQLRTLGIDGQTLRTLNLSSNDVRDPSWAPFSDP